MQACGSSKQIDLQGHRGARGLSPENTLPSFERAMEIGVNTLELDVVISKDKKVVVSHEPYMNPEICTKPNGETIDQGRGKDYNLYTMDYSEIKAFDCGSKKHRRFPEQINIKVSKPLLSEVIELAEKYSRSSIKYNIEIKSSPDYDGNLTPPIAEFANLVLDVINEYNITDRTTLQSFDLRALEQVHQQAPNLTTALLVDSSEKIDSKLAMLSYTPEIISPYFMLLDAKTVKDYQKKGFKIIPWTVNEIQNLKMVASWGVDGIITDYPDRFIRNWK